MQNLFEVVSGFGTVGLSTGINPDLGVASKLVINMTHHKPVIEFGIIGLGRFGFALATRLAEAGKEVLVIDNNENKIKQIRHLTDNAFLAGQIDKQTLEEAGFQNCETVIVCIGENIEVSILTALNIIAIEEEGKTTTEIGPEDVLRENEKIVIIGKNENIKKFEAYLHSN